MTEKNIKALVVCDIASGKEVERIAVDRHSPRSIEKILRGLLRQVDSARYYVKEEEG